MHTSLLHDALPILRVETIELKLEYYTNVKAAQDFTNDFQAKLLKEEAKRIDAASENTKQIRDERQIAASKLAKENSAQDTVLDHMQTQWRRQLTASKTKQTKEHNKEVTKQTKKRKKDAPDSDLTLTQLHPASFSLLV